MAQLKKQHLNAFTILETMASTVIVLAVFTVSLMIILNVSRSSSTSLQIQATQVMRGLAEKAMQNGTAKSQEIAFEEFTISMNAAQYKLGGGLQLLQLQARNAGGSTIAAHKVIYEAR